MTTKIPITPEALARLTPAERQAFEDATERVAAGHKPPMGTVVTLAETIQRLITEAAEAAAAEKERIARECTARATASVPGVIRDAWYEAAAIAREPS